MSEMSVCCTPVKMMKTTGESKVSPTLDIIPLDLNEHYTSKTIT